MRTPGGTLHLGAIASFESLTLDRSLSLFTSKAMASTTMIGLRGAWFTDAAGSRG